MTKRTFKIRDRLLGLLGVILIWALIYHFSGSLELASIATLLMLLVSAIGLLYT